MSESTECIAEFDADLWAALEGERARQEDHVELIASENFASRRVLAAQGSVLTNKSAEGYPGRRYYGGCEHVDRAEALGMLISAMLPSVEAAPQLAPLVVVLLLTFSGYFLNEDSIPDWIGWIKYISFIRYAFQGLMINEFAGNQFTCVYEDGSPADVCLDGDAYLQRLNFDDDTIALSCVLLIVIAVAFNAVAYGVLVARRPRFQKLDTPSPT